MPNISSAKKRMRQSEKRRMRNRVIKTSVKTEVRRFLAALEGGDTQAAKSEFRAVASVLDRAVGRGVLHRNTAARRKSRLAARLNQAAAPAPAPDVAPDAAPDAVPEA